jgi:DNA-binding SARP family transcriptional activator
MTQRLNRKPCHIGDEYARGRWRRLAACRSYLLGDDVEFRILGPLTVERTGEDRPVPSAKMRTVLAYLLIRAGQVVMLDALLDEVWGDRPPRSATNTLQTYISQLRQLLEPGRESGVEPRVLRTLPGGYMLQVEPHTVDRARFEHTLADARAAMEAGEPEKAAERLRAGLSLWRGPALANVRGAAVEAEAARLNELRLVALEIRIEADLARGRHDEVVGELDRLVREHPWRERFIGQLMVALYRCGRQADALACYREARERLVAELGINPSPVLQDVERRILRQHADLELPVAQPVEAERANEPQPPASTPAAEAKNASTRPRRLGRAAALSGGVLVIAVVIGGLALAWWPQRGRDPATADAAPVSEVFNEFDLAVHPGIGYDLDIPPGRPADWHTSNNPRSPDYDFLDLYRTSRTAPEGENQISGVDVNGVNVYNAIHLVADTDPPAICRRAPQQGGGNVHMQDLHVGAKVCLRTGENRWAMITVRRMPADRAALIFVHVTVLTS